MALRLTSMHVMDDEENENKRNGLSGVNRLKAMKEKQEDVPQPAANRNEPETEPTGVARLQALKNGQKQTTVTPAPETPSAVPASPAEPAAQQGRIRPGWDTADAAGASKAQDRREKPITAAVDNLRRLNNAVGVNIDDLREDLTQRAAERDAADSALGQILEPWNRANATAQNLRSQVAAYETKLGMLSDTIANSEDPEERRRAQQESQALDLYYQKAQRAAERYESRYNELNTQFQQLAIARNKANRALETGLEQYDTLLSLGDKRAANYEQQARDLRDRYNAAYQSGMPNAWELQRQAENAEAKAAAERQNYAEYLAKTKGEGYANRYLQGIEDGNRAKAEKASFGEKVLNTVAGLGENFFSGVGGAPWIFMARLMEIPEDALYAITGNEAFNQDAPGRGPRTSQILQTNDPFRNDAEARKQRAGSLGGMLIDTGYAAGNMLGMTGLAGQVTGALSNTALMSKLSSIAESSTLATSPAARRGAQMAINALRSPGNLGVSLSSGVSSYSEALANGASFSPAMANGISKAVTEYVSNRLFSGMPLENAPGEKGYVTKAIEFLADKLGKSEALAAFNRTTGGKVLGWIYDKAGEGLEEVVTGLLDPVIDRMTYDKEADWIPKLDALTDEFIGGVMLSLLMSGGEAVLTPSMTRAQIAEDLVRQGVPKAEARKYAGMIYKGMKAAERAQKAVQEAVETQEAGITEAPEAVNENTPPVPQGVQSAPQTVLQQKVDKYAREGKLSGQDARDIMADPQAMQTLIDAGLITGREMNDSEGRTKVAQAAEQYIRQQAEQQNTPPVPVQAEAPAETQATTINAETPPVPGSIQTENARETVRTTENNAQIGVENAQNPEKSLSGIERLNAAREKESKTVQRTLASERQKTAEKAASMRDAGFTTAGEDATARIRSEESWDAEEKAVGQALRDLGYEPTFAVGLIENAEGKSVPYLLEGNKLAVRSDHRNQSVQEIAERAVGQALNIDQGVRNQVMETITQARAAAKAARQVEKAAEKPAEKPAGSARAQVAIESARAAGASEEDGALAGRLADIIGRDIRFFNEAEQNGAWKNGYTQNGVIYINAQAKKPVAWVVGHELTHNVEHSKIYDSLKKLAQKEMGLNWSMRVQSRLDASARIAQKLGDESVRLTDPADAEREIVADFFADRLLSDEAAIRRVCEYEPVTARNIRDYIKGLLRKLGGKETTLERALTLYNKALKDVAAKAQANAEGRMRLKGTEGARPRTAVESVKKYSLNVETIDYAVNYTARTEEAKEQLRLLQKDITELDDIQDRINKEAGGRAAKNIHDLNDYLQAHPDVWQRLWDMQQELNDAGIRCDFVTEPGSPNVIDERQVPGGLKGLPIEYVESTTGKRYKFTAFWRNMPQMLLDSMSHDSREKLRTEIMKGVEDAYSRKTGERDLLPYFQDQFPSTKEIEKVAGARTIKNIRNQTQSRVQAPIRDAEKTVAALNLNSACPMFTIGNNGCYLDACYLTQMANGATGTNLFRSAWYTGELLQISDADIQRMNELGGLRVNGVGDTTMDNKSQLKDALRHAGMRGLKVKMITKQRASLEVLAEMHEEGTDVSHVTVQPSMDNLWIPAKLDDVYGAGVRGTTQLAKTVEAGRNEAAATGYEEMFGRATKVVDGTLYRKYGFTPEQIREMQEDFPFVNITPRYVVCTAAEIAEIALNRNGEYVNGGKLIQTLMHGKVPAGCVSDYPGEIINFGGARHVVERKDGKWHFYGEFIGKGGLVGKIIDGPNTPYGKVQRYVEQNYTKAEQDKIWLTLKNQMCCQANDFKDACAGCQSLCARGCAAFSSEDFDYTKFNLRDKAKAMEMDEEPKTDGLQLGGTQQTAKQESGLRLGGERQYSVGLASDIYRNETDFSEAMPLDEFREKIKAENSAESYFPKGLSEKFMKAIARKGTFNRTKLYRGIEAAELDFLVENKYLQSNGSYNFQNQQGQTLADEDPEYALSYATGFAPKAIADKHYKDGLPSYLVEFLNSPNLNVEKNDVQESYTYGQIGQDYITRIFEIEYDPETQQDMVRDVTEEMRGFLPNLGKGLAEAAHGIPMFFRDKTTGTIVYAVQGADGWENGQYISEKDPSMTWSYEQMSSPVFSKHAPAMLGVSGNEADLEAMTVGADGTLVPERGMQYSVSDSDADTYNRTALVTEDTVDKWLKDYAAKSSPKYAQAYITRMTPKQFVDLTTSTTGRLLIGNQTGALDAETLIEATRDQPLQIRISDGEVIGHEGRHRATALSRAGVESIPVLVFDSSNKYSKTDVPEMTLQGQDFGHSRSSATETLRDLIPLSYENRDRIVQEYGTQPVTERMQKEYSGRKTMQFSAEDEEYLAAVEAGDMETAQRMVDEAAKQAGYNRIGDYYVGNQIGLTEPEPTKRQMQAYELGQKYGDTDAGYRRLLMDDPDTYERIINNSTLERWYLAGTRGTMPEYRLAIRYGDIPEGSRSRNWGTGELERGTSVVDFLTSKTQNGKTIYDTIYGMQNTSKNIVGGWDFGIFGSDGEPLLVDAQPVVAFSDVAKIKSAAPVTYDDAGKPIPLSERFNRVNEDIRYSAEDSDDEYRQAPGTEALDKLGIRLAGSKGKYHLAEQLLERDKAAKELMRATKKAEKKLKATKAEREFAAGIAAGIYEERDIPSSMNKDTVNTLADYYAAEESFKANMLAEVRGRINAEYQDEAEELLSNVDHFKKLSMLMLNERTPDRSFRAMFGPTQGKAIFDWLIRPVQMNEAAKTRWHQEQLDKVRQFEDSNGKTRALTRAESELTMLVMEGKAAAAAVADMEKKGLDAKGIRNAAENIRNGEDAADAAWEFGLKDKERELARNYARWMDTQEKLKNADSKIIENAAETYSKIFDEFYDGINDFLVAHGYEPIGYIKGYAPHMQPEETQSLLEKAFDKMGISLGNDKAQGLPASIAGETAYFKPNKRWDPYFLHRTGTQAEYDIEKAYQSYVGYLSDILFHTDDIMRVRNMERMIRKTYASDEIRDNLEWIQEIRNSPSEERLGMLRDAGKIGKTTILSGSEVNEKLDEWEEEQFNALKEDRNYNNLVMWLSNYANILAGKQSFADRGWEYSLGRNSLNFANRLQAAFQRSLVAGSLTSALNQTAQLPMIKAELGDRWYYAALKDILTGQTRGFWKDSDFLTGKHGVDMLYTDNYDKFISALFKPSTVVDNIVSTTAVRGAFLKAIHQGQSYSEAMQTADDFGRRVMGSREKGTRPLAYESKGLFSRMIHMFQVEAANSWDHIASDLPYEIKEIARTQGKPKAARTLAALLVKALLSTFLLNRLTEEAYGGTPAPFDVIGLAMNFVASGQGMTTNQYLKTIIDNGLEKIGSDRLFGTEDVDAEFDVGKGLEELGYNVMNDVPLLRNLAGVLGLGDQTVPLPGAGGEFADAFTAAGDLIKEGADEQTIENLIRAAAKLGAQFVPAGRQLTKTAEGIETVIRGGSYSKKGKLQYPVDSTEDQVRAILFGKNATNAAQEHWASGENTLTDKQTELVSTMRGWGMSGAEARQVIRDIGGFEADTDPETGKTISGSKKAKVVDYIDGLKLTSDQKDQLYLAQGYAESGLDETPWHAKGGSSGRGKTYSMGGLRLPSTPERREPISSGLRLQSAPAARPSSGGLRLK